jgi:hypothetical protein
MARPKGDPGARRVSIGSAVTPEREIADGTPESLGLIFVYLGDNWAWRAGCSQTTLAWSTQHPPGSRSVLNRDQTPRGLR